MKAGRERSTRRKTTAPNTRRTRPEAKATSGKNGLRVRTNVSTTSKDTPMTLFTRAMKLLSVPARASDLRARLRPVYSI